jgi:hypothetical protein
VFIRFLIYMVGAVLLLTAVIRFSLSKSHTDGRKVEDELAATLPLASLKWMNQSRVLVSKNWLSDSGELRVGELFLLKQRVGVGEECWVGLFAIEKLSGETLSLRSLSGKRSPSRLYLWAQAQHLKVNWAWQRWSSPVDEQPVGQSCQRWIHTPPQQNPVAHRVAQSRYFVRGTIFSEVRVQPAEHATIEVDLVRGGWWIQPKNGQRILLIQARRATTGVFESHPIQFDGQRKKIRSSSERHSLERRAKNNYKHFVLPGWE